MVSPGDTVSCVFRVWWLHEFIYHQLRRKPADICGWYHRQYVFPTGAWVRFHSACWYFGVDERLSLWANSMWNIKSGPDKVSKIIPVFGICSFLHFERNGVERLHCCISLNWKLTCIEMMSSLAITLNNKWFILHLLCV